MILPPLAEVSAGGWLLLPLLGGVALLFLATGLVATALAFRLVGRRGRDSVIWSTVVTALATWWIVQFVAAVPGVASAFILLAALAFAFVVALGVVAIQGVFNHRTGPAPRVSPRVVGSGAATGLALGIILAVLVNDNRLLAPWLVAGAAPGAAAATLIARRWRRSSGGDLGRGPSI